MEYSSKRGFRIWAYTGAHNFLLLRSLLIMSDVEGHSDETSFTLDIEFWGVEYIDIPTHIGDILVREIKDGVPVKFESFIDRPGSKIYEIKSGAIIGYIIAAGFLVGKSNWWNENRISNPELKYDEIIALSSN